MQNRIALKTKLPILLIAMTQLLSLHRANAQLADVPIVLNYQGRLLVGGAPATGTYDMTFTLYTNAAGGNPVSDTFTNAPIYLDPNNPINTRLYWRHHMFDFSTNDPFGPFGADSPWYTNVYVEISTRTNGSGPFTPLTPRQQVTPALQSYYALNAATAVLATTATNFSGSVSGDVSGTQGATVVSSVGGQTAANIASGVIAANAATSGNVANTIVARDGSGSFSAGSAALAGSLFLPSPAVIYSGTNTMMIESGSYYAGAGAGAADFARPNWPAVADLGNVGVGDGALNRDNVGSSNTAVGEGALKFNTSGSRNKADGYQALYANTTGSDNTALGYQSMHASTNGNYNTASGALSLSSNTSGSENTANGYRALLSNTSGDRNTASGMDALVANTIGSWNTADGRHALHYNASGSFNTAAGAIALYSGTNGSYDTANGYEALFANNADANTANGALALYSNTTGSNNIGLGYQAGMNLTTGNNNIDIGNTGIASEGNTIRIGTTNLQTSTYIAGIYNASPANALPVVVNSSGQLGTGGNWSLSPSLPASPIGSISLPDEPEMLALAGRYAYVPISHQTQSQLQIYDVSTPASPALVGSASADTDAYFVTVAGRYAYLLAYGAHTLQVFDVSDPAAPIGMGKVSTGLGPESIVVQGGYGYVVTHSGNALEVYDVSNPNSPAQVGQAAGFSSDSLAVAGNYAYVVGHTNSNYALQIFNIANPNSPAFSGSVAIPNAAFVAVSGRYAYVAAVNTLQVVDISNPGTPVLKGSVTAPGANLNVMTVADRYVYVANPGGSSLVVFDVSNPLSPSVVGSVPTAANTCGVAVSGHYAYVQTASGPLQIFDLGGAFIQQLESGSIETGSIQTRDDITVGNSLNVRGGLTVSGNARISTNLAVEGSVYAHGVQVTSDRNAKQNFVALNPRAVLARVSAMPVTQWNYKTDPLDVRHIGPMAQDFQAAFGLSHDDKHISVVDEGGVALAAIQGLKEELDDACQAIRQRDGDLEKLRLANQELARRLAVLEQLNQAHQTSR